MLLAAVVLLVAAVLAFGVLAPPERCPDVSADELTARATAAVDWFTRNQLDDGTWLYEYDGESDRDLGSYNIVRHAGAIMGLYQAATAGIPGALESADRGRAWLLPHLLERDGWTAVSYDGRTAVGATALFVAGLVERRLATGDTSDDNLIRWLSRFLVAQTEPSGAVLSDFDNAAGEPIPDRYSKYYTGEAYWALARVHRLFPDEGWGDTSDRIGNYLATSRDDVEGYWPPLPDHWAAYGLAETVEFPERDPDRPLTDAELEHTRRQAGLFGNQVRWVSQQAGPWGSAVRGSFTPRGGGYGVVGEALTGLWLTAQADARLDGIRAPVADRAACIAALAMDAQEVGAEAAAAPAPGRVDGAWFVDGVTRMDDQQHAISALLRTVAVVEDAADEGDDAPSWWLWVLALVAAINPVLVAFGVPRGPPRGERVTIGLLGGALGSVLLVACRAARRTAARRARRVGAGGTHRRRHRRRRRRAGQDVAAPAVVGAGPHRPQGGDRPRRRAVVRRAGSGAAGDRRRRRPRGRRDRRRRARRRRRPRRGHRGAPARRSRPPRVGWAGRLLSAAGVVACILLVIDGVYDV